MSTQERMSTRERVARMFEHQDADRIPVTDIPWDGTIARWQKEGMPKDAEYTEYFGLDHMVLLFADNSPRFEEKTIEETETYRIYTTRWGATQKELKGLDTTPEYLDFKIPDRESYEKYKDRIAPDEDRIDWAGLKRNYKRQRENGAWMSADLYFGFDWLHSRVVGTENMLMALIEDPEWCSEMFNHFLNTHLALFDRMWDAGYVFDAVRWPDDMGYKGTTFFSKDVYREILKPVHKKAIDWAHAKGIKACMHSCGNITSFIDDFVEIGLDCLNPLEVKSGIDPLAVKKEYGGRLVLHGGLNAALFSDTEAFLEAMRATIPVMKENGGYIFSSDHSVPPQVSAADFRRIVEEAKRLGKY